MKEIVNNSQITSLIELVRIFGRAPVADREIVC